MKVPFYNSSRSGALLAAVLLLAGAAQAESLDAVLGRMDQAAKTTKSISADFTRTEYLAIFGDSDEATGHMNLRRDGDQTKGVVNFTKPDEYAVYFPGGGKVEKLLPKAKLLEVYNLGSRGGLIDQYLLLGFANSSAELRKDYEIALGGEETVGGKKTTRIDLTPKSKEVREQYFAKIEMWIPEGEATALQVKLTKPSKSAKADYYLFEYSNVKVNPDLPKSAFELEVPKGVQRKEMKL